MNWLIKFFNVKPSRRRRVRTIGSVVQRKHYQQHKAAARVVITERLPQLNQVYGFAYHRISIRNQSTRWGSCSKQGNLNFSYKLLFLSQMLQDYVLVHELCHLQELNHSPRFWALVAQTVPNYRVLRKELRIQARYLHTRSSIL